MTAASSTTAPRRCTCGPTTPQEALARLYALDRQHVFLEGGPILARAFLQAGLVDEVVAYVAPMLLGSRRQRGGRPGHHHDRRRPAPARHRRHRAAGPRRRGHQRPTDHDSDHEEKLMFTGIVEELGSIAAIEDQGDAIRLTVSADTVLEGTGLGDSISVNGCCLTVAELGDGTWTADLMQETLDKTSLAGVVPGDRVNLERAVTVDKRLGGHIVQGHVDGVGEVISRSPSEHWDVVEISLAHPSGPLPRRQGIDHGRRRQPHRRRGRRRQLHRQPHPRDPRPDHARRTPGRRPGQPRGRRHRQARREAARQRTRRSLHPRARPQENPR